MAGKSHVYIPGYICRSGAVVISIHKDGESNQLTAMLRCLCGTRFFRPVHNLAKEKHHFYRYGIYCDTCKASMSPSWRVSIERRRKRDEAYTRLAKLLDDEREKQRERIPVGKGRRFTAKTLCVILGIGQKQFYKLLKQYKLNRSYTDE